MQEKKTILDKYLFKHILSEYKNTTFQGSVFYMLFVVLIDYGTKKDL